MSKQYQPKSPFNVAVQLLKRTKTKINGVNAETFEHSGAPFFCSAVSWGGTEKTVNGVYAVIDTMTFECWYNPNIEEGDRVQLLDDNSIYTVLASPENINRRNQYLKFKGERISG